MNRSFSRRSPRPALALAALAGAAIAGDGLLETPSRSWHTGDQVITEAYRPEALATADVDGDGDLDVVLAHNGNFIAPRFNVLRNDGAGALGVPETHPISGETSDVLAADLDGDGDPDLAFTQSDLGSTGERVCVFLNDGSGSFGPESAWTTGKGPWGIAAFDADRDGDLDLATANFAWNEADVTILYNDGAAGFAQRADFPVAAGEQPLRVHAGDLTGDGWEDLVVTVRGGQPAFYSLANTGTGAFGPAVAHAGGATTGSELVGAAIGDVDLDGDLDVVTGRDQDFGSVGMSVGLFENLGGGQFSSAQPVQTPGAFAPVWNLAVVDVTADGWPDLVGTGYGTAYGWMLIPSLGGGAFGTAVAYRSGEGARDLAAVDVDLDGDRDVVVADSGSLGVTVHTSDGGAFSMPPAWIVPGGAAELAAADLDHDGDVDLVTAASWVTTLRNDGAGGFAVETQNALIGIQKRTRLADVTGDGFADLVTLDADTNVPYQFHVLANQGGTLGPATSYLIGSCGPGDLVAVDFDGDADLDLAITEYLGCPGSNEAVRLFFFRNDGTGGFTAMPPFLSFAITKGERIEAGDLDGDGDADLVTTHPDTIAVWRGHGDGTFDLGVEYALGEWGPKHLRLADLDADGALDAATSNFGNTFRGECLSVVLGNGDGSFGPPAVHYAIFSLELGNPSGIRAADLDGDLDLDLVAGAYAADDVAVLRNRGDGTFDPEERYGVNGKVGAIEVADLDGDGRPDVAASIGLQPPIQSAVTTMRGLAEGGPGVAFCAGDGSLSTRCPCNNLGAPGKGCDNSAATGGARLVASGATSPDTVVLTSSGELASVLSIFLQGDASLAGGAPFGDGVRCVAGTLVRLYVRNASGGVASAPSAGDLPVGARSAALGDPIAPGSTRWYQVYYRDPVLAFCALSPVSAFNVSSGVAIAW